MKMSQKTFFYLEFLLKLRENSRKLQTKELKKSQKF